MISFDDFFRTVHGYAPFAWQSALAARVLAEGWPQAVGLPTAAGKTACIDIAVYALAAKGKAMPRRILFVVDRRVVVDEAYLRAERVRDAINTVEALQDIKVRLATLGGEVPLRVSRLRGGLAPDDAWARSPAQPVVCCSTVDQVGSRLLFRAYGRTSRYGWSIPAGLVGTDSLIFLDEAHLSDAFAQTLRRVERLSVGFAAAWGAPPRFVELSATSRAPAASQFCPALADIADPVLRRRLDMPKPTWLKDCKHLEDNGGCDGEALDAFAKDATKYAVLLTQPSELCGVILNRVARARAVYQKLVDDGHEAILLTGRARPIERDALLAKYWDRMKAGRSEESGPRLFVVATQCVEAGADIDFDRLVTEVASIDALRQRVGRLCRLGRERVAGAMPDAKPRAVLLLTNAKKDSVYGDALTNTKGWIEEVGGQEKSIDFGVEAFSLLWREVPAETQLGMQSQRVYAPTLFPRHVDLLAMTSHPPEPDLDLPAYLHGPRTGPADVTVVWREISLGSAEDAALAIELVRTVPPSSAEGLALPIWAVQQWAADVTDTEGAADPSRRGAPQSAKRALRLDGRGDYEVIRLHEAKPGDTLVVPASFGGCDAFGWSPAAPGPVTDLGDLARARSGKPAILRLLPGERVTDDESAKALVERLRNGDDSVRAEVARAICGRLRLVRSERRDAVIAIAASKLQPTVAAGDQSEGFVTDEDEGLYTDRVGLAKHGEDVRRQARQFAEGCGLPADLVDALDRAGKLHDIGKADPRFQAMLLGGDPIGAELQTEPLAKSPTSGARGRGRGGYPVGGRHELVSVRMAERLVQAEHRDLILHLVGSHHGRCRPFAPVVVDPEPEDVRGEVDGVPVVVSSATGLERLDSGVAQRFVALNAKYGPWRLALLEAILRLADHRVSESYGGAS